MSQPSGKPVYIPPYSGVRLIECRDHFELAPVPQVRAVFGYGKIKAREATIDKNDPRSEAVWDDLKPDEEVWAVMQWYVYSDGHQESGSINYLRPERTEQEVKASMEQMINFECLTREQLLNLTQCFLAKEEDFDYIDNKHPNYQSEPDPNCTDEYDVYHARLKVMAELQPQTVELIKIANSIHDSAKRNYVELEAVQSYFAEIAHYLTEDEVLAWQKNNPVGTGWMCEFAKVMGNPRRQLDPVNHELALNWLRSKYNEMTAEQLSGSIVQRIWLWLVPGFKITADFIKKRRERLGLTTKRSPGPRSKTEQ